MFLTVWRRFRWVLIVLLPVAAYWAFLDYSFQFDDYTFIVEHPHVRWEPKQLFSYFLRPGEFFHRSMVWISLGLNYNLSGLDPAAFRLTNLLFHIGVALLLYRLVVRLSPLDSTFSRTTAFFAALIYAVHPVHTNVIQYIWPRTEILCAFFYLGALNCFAEMLLSEKGSKRSFKNSASPILLKARIRPLFLAMTPFLWGTGAVVCGLLALASKSVAISLPATAWLMALAVRKRAGLPRRLLLGTAAAGLAVAGLFVWYGHGEIWTESYRPVWVNFMTEMNVIPHYLRLLLIPAGLNVDHDFPITKSFDAATLLSMGFIAVSVAVGGVLAWRGDLAGFFLLWFFVTVAPASSLIPRSDVMLEYRTYLPSMGVCVLIGWMFALVIREWGQSSFFKSGFAILKKRDNDPIPAESGFSPALPLRWGFSTLFALYIFLFVVLLVDRAPAWETQYTLWADAVTKSPKKGRTHSALGKVFLLREETRRAELQFEKAVEIQPYWPETYRNIGGVYFQRGELAKAARAFERAIRIEEKIHGEDRYAEGHSNLGLTYLRMGEREKALEHLNRALEITPWLPTAYVNRAKVLLELNRPEEALSDLRNALELYPEIPDGRRLLVLTFQHLGGRALLTGEFEEAKNWFRKELEASPEDPDAHHHLGVACMATGDLEEAVRHLERAAQLDPDNPEIVENLLKARHALKEE